ncbi:MAG: thioredoxin family protein [Planctomycetota bacterium]
MKKTTKLVAAGLAAATLAVTAGFTAVDGHGHHDHKHAMTAEVGTTAPNFTLADLDGNEHTLQTWIDEGKTVVIEWFNPECPFVVKQHERNSTMKDTYDFAKKHGGDDLVWIAINSGAPGKQGAGIEKNKGYAEKWDLAYPILVDESGKVGKMYAARTTPHMYIINGEGTLVYAGAIDNNSSPTKAGDVNYVKAALKQVFAGETVTTATTRPYGCSVKYAK